MTDRKLPAILQAAIDSGHLAIVNVELPPAKRKHTADIIEKAVAAHELAGVPLDDALTALIEEEGTEEPVSTDTYKIRRFFQDERRKTKTIKTGLTLEQAQEHCQRDDTHGDGWFDGYDKET